MLGYSQHGFECVKTKREKEKRREDKINICHNCQKREDLKRRFKREDLKREEKI